MLSKLFVTEGMLAEYYINEVHSFEFLNNILWLSLYHDSQNILADDI